MYGRNSNKNNNHDIFIAYYKSFYNKQLVYIINKYDELYQFRDKNKEKIIKKFVELNKKSKFDSVSAFDKLNLSLKKCHYETFLWNCSNQHYNQYYILCQNFLFFLF